VGRNHLAHRTGDAINGVLAAAGYNSIIPSPAQMAAALAVQFPGSSKNSGRLSTDVSVVATPPFCIDALRALALNAIAERDAAIAERDRLITMNEKLRQLLRKAQGFEAKSERLAKLHPDQLNLALEDIEQAIAKTEAIEEKSLAADAPRKRRINRGALPAHLPRIQLQTTG
jgi:transposase